MIVIKRKCKFFEVGNYTTIEKREEKMETVKEVQDYLAEHEIIVTETSIINAAIKIATRWGGKGVFVCEFERRVEE